MLINYAEKMGLELPATREYTGFNDDSNIAGFAKEAVERSFKAGIIVGKRGNVFDPKGEATRAELAAMLVRFLEAIPRSD